MNVYTGYHEIIYDSAKDILHSDNFKQTREYIQHGTVSVYKHCLYVAECSIWLNRKFRLGCKEKELIRGALLHDYFLYDWHDKDHVSIFKLHGFFHPTKALNNAKKEYELSEREADIIKKHMWPMTVVPPRYREAWVVTLADKYCSTMETLHLKRGNAYVRYHR